MLAEELGVTADEVQAAFASVRPARGERPTRGERPARGEGGCEKPAHGDTGTDTPGDYPTTGGDYPTGV